MYYELALISVVIGSGYWGVHFVRRDTERLYGVLNIVAAVLAGLGFYGSRHGDSSFGIAGAIGVGAGTCFLVLGPVARNFARRAAAAERFTLAKYLLDIADVLAPGSGVADEKQLLAAMREIRDGNIDQTVQALLAAKTRAPQEAQLAIDERVAMLYLAAYRWNEAIAHAEEHLFGSIPADAAPPTTALRRALGIAPPVWCELLGAYAYVGKLDEAARMLARLEEVCAGRPEAAMWLHRGRMIFLALAGRVKATEALVEPRRSRHMKPAARQYWIGVAHERAGESAAARTAYTKARAGSRGRPRTLIEQAIERLPAAKPVEPGELAREVIARVEAEPVPDVAEPTRRRGFVAVPLLVVTLLVVALVTRLTIGPTSDVGVLVRGGALVRSLAREGEWWRFVTCVFVQVGGMHLLFNATGLWFVGRLTESLFGSWRTLAIFALSALAGAAASILASPAGMSAGASGGLMGIAGAVFAELTIHRKRHRVAWSRGAWGAFLIVIVSQLGLGTMYSALDQWAHGVGLAVGALAGAALSPNLRGQPIMRHASRAIGIAFIALGAVCAVLVARTSLADSFDRIPVVDVELEKASVTVPATWQHGHDEAFDPDMLASLTAFSGLVQESLAAELAKIDAAERKRMKEQELEHITVAATPLIPLPAGWVGSELIATTTDTLGDVQRFRVVIAGKSDTPTTAVVVTLYVPELIAAGAPGTFTDIIASVTRR
jgi:membrane associated rhomboid family serine protease